MIDTGLIQSTLVVRGGSLATKPLMEKLTDMVGGHIDLSAQAVTADDAWEQVCEIIFEGETGYKRCCVTTPQLADEHGLIVISTPREADPYHCDVRYPDQISEENADTIRRIAHRFRAAFRGPFLRKELQREWTTDDIRGLQRPA